jgi:hypothetical protein
MTAIERAPVFVGSVTLATGVALAAAPGAAARALGLEGQDAALRALGAADLVLVPGLLRGRPRWPWMVSRAGLNLAMAAYMIGVGKRSGARTLLALTVVDGATGLALLRASA